MAGLGCELRVGVSPSAAPVSYLSIFLQSNLLELPIYLSFFAQQKKLFRWPWVVLFVTMMNAVTHPVVFFGIMNLPLTYLQTILLAETFAIVAEAMLLKWLLKNHFAMCLLASLLANLLSWQLGPILTYLVFGGPAAWSFQG